jgi:anthranilate/para-aminobenzoate synthase component I
VRVAATKDIRATAPTVGGLLGDMDVGGSTVVRNLPAPVAALLEPWLLVADSALFGDVTRRLSHAKKHAAKLELPKPECRDQTADVEAKIAAAAASCDGALRRALAVLCRFARAAPATLPDGSATPIVGPARYAEMVARAKDYILAGDVFHVVLAQRFSDVGNRLQEMRALSSYMAQVLTDALAEFSDPRRDAL